MSIKKACNLGLKKKTLEEQETKCQDLLVAYFFKSKYDYETVGLRKLSTLRNELRFISFENLTEEKVDCLDEELNNIALELNNIFIQCTKLMLDEFVFNTVVK